MRKTLSILLLVSGSMVLAQNEGINPDYIPGKWQINVQATIDAIPAHVRDGYDAKSDEAKQAIANGLAARQFHFLPDGSYMGVVVNRANYPGSWELTAPTIHITLEQGGSFSPAIQSLTETTMILRAEEDPQSTELFHYLHLTLLER